MKYDIQDILRGERNKFAPIHIFFWVLTWVATGAIFLYCNGWKISANFPISDRGSGTSTGVSNVVERFGFILVDTQSNRLTIGIDGDIPVKKDIQKSVTYGAHSVSLSGDQGELLSFDVDISTDRPFFRRNFTLFHSIAHLSGAVIPLGAEKTLIGECSQYNITQSGAYYKHCSKDFGSWSYGSMLVKNKLFLKNNDQISLFLANSAGYVDGSGALVFPKNYFLNRSYEPLSFSQYPLRDLFSHLGQDFVITASGEIVSLGSDSFTHMLPIGSWSQAKSIGGDLFLVDNSGSIYFFDELYRSKQINNIKLTLSGSYLQIMPYEHAYLISSRSGTYLYQPYQDRAEKLSDGGLVGINGEILDLIMTDGKTERLMLSAINPSTK